MKKIFVITASIILMLGLCIGISAAEIVESGTCGDNLTWTLDSEGLLTISGTGQMSWSSWLNSNAANIKTVVLEDGIENIINSAFANCSNLKSITIPNGVESIGAYAFNNCLALENVIIPDSVSVIGDYAFFCCRGLSKIVFPSNLISIGKEAFTACSFKNIVFLGIPEQIGASAFNFCRNIQNVYLPGSESDWNTITIESGNDTLINAERIYILDFGTCGNALMWLLDREGILTISGTGDILTSPWNKEDVKSVVIENGVTSICENAFADCANLESVTLSFSLITVKKSAFSGADNLKTVSYIGGENNWIAMTIEEDNDSFINAEREYLTPTFSLTGTCGENVNWALSYVGTLTIYGSGDITSSPAFKYKDYVELVIVEDGITGICESAFAGYTNLDDVRFTKSVKNIGANAFGGVKYIEHVSFTGREDHWNSINIEEGNDVLINAPRYYSSRSWSGRCGDNVSWSLTENDGLLTISGIGEMTSAPAKEYKEYIESVLIYKGVTNIAENAFLDCTNLKEITFSNSVTTINSSAFSGTDNIQKVCYDGTENDWNTMIIESGNENLSNASRKYFSLTIAVNEGDIVYSVLGMEIITEANDSFWLPRKTGYVVVNSRQGAQTTYYVDAEKCTVKKIHSGVISGINVLELRDRTPIYDAESGTKKDINGLRFKMTHNPESRYHPEHEISEIGFLSTIESDYVIEGVGYDYVLDMDMANNGYAVVGKSYDKNDGTDIYFSKENDDAWVISAVLYNIPISANNVNLTIAMRPYYKVEDTYIYGEITRTSLFKIAMAIRYDANSWASCSPSMKDYVNEIINLVFGSLDELINADADTWDMSTEQIYGENGKEEVTIVENPLDPSDKVFHVRGLMGNEEHSNTIWAGGFEWEAGASYFVSYNIMADVDSYKGLPNSSTFKTDIKHDYDAYIYSDDAMEPGVWKNVSFIYNIPDNAWIFDDKFSICADPVIVDGLTVGLDFYIDNIIIKKL